MPEPPQDSVDVIAAAIRGHCALFPEAADSADGIRQWWLLPDLHEEPLALVELALEQLVAEGVMSRVVLEDGSVIHRCGVC